MKITLRRKFLKNIFYINQHSIEYFRKISIIIWKQIKSLIEFLENEAITNRWT
jgi:hypothetical protein